MQVLGQTIQEILDYVDQRVQDDARKAIVPWAVGTVGAVALLVLLFSQRRRQA